MAKRKEVVKLILESEVGILINSEDTIHSKVFTSPIKYFEYLRGGLKVLAVDFTSHENLPYSEDITFFQIIIRKILLINYLIYIQFQTHKKIWLAFLILKEQKILLHAWRDSNPQPSDPKSDALSS